MLKMTCLLCDLVIGFTRKVVEILTTGRSTCSFSIVCNQATSCLTMLHSLRVLTCTISYLLGGVGKGNLAPLSGPLLTKTRGLYSSSFSINAEFSKRFNIADLP